MRRRTSTGGRGTYPPPFATKIEKESGGGKEKEVRRIKLLAAAVMALAMRAGWHNRHSRRRPIGVVIRASSTSSSSSSSSPLLPPSTKRIVDGVSMEPQCLFDHRTEGNASTDAGCSGRGDCGRASNWEASALVPVPVPVPVLKKARQVLGLGHADSLRRWAAVGGAGRWRAEAG